MRYSQHLLCKLTNFSLINVLWGHLNNTWILLIQQLNEYFYELHCSEKTRIIYEGYFFDVIIQLDWIAHVTNVCILFFRHTHTSHAENGSIDILTSSDITLFCKTSLNPTDFIIPEQDIMREGHCKIKIPKIFFKCMVNRLCYNIFAKHFRL